MTPERKAEIARINGSKSRGPRTPAGKGRSARNATSHGIYSSELILSSESRQDYDTLHAAFRDRFQPSTPAEHQLVIEMVNAHWFTRRVQTFESHFLSAHPPGTIHDSPKASRTWDTVSRAESRYQRQFQRAFQTLQGCRKIGIEPTPHPATPDIEPTKSGIEPTASSAPPNKSGIEPTSWVRFIAKPILTLVRSWTPFHPVASGGLQL